MKQMKYIIFKNAFTSTLDLRYRKGLRTNMIERCVSSSVSTIVRRVHQMVLDQVWEHYENF